MAIYGSRRYFGRANYGRFKKPYRRYKRKYRVYKSRKPAELRKQVGYDLAVKTPLFRISPYITKMFYYDYQQAIAGAAGAWNVDFFTANGLYDPDASGVGHQPIGYDQMTLLYEHWIVTHARIKVCFHNETAAPIRIGILVSPDTNTLTDPTRNIENGLCTTYMLQEHSSGSDVITLEYSLDIKKYFGRKSNREMMNDPEMKGTLGGNPTEMVHFGVFGFDPYGANAWSARYDIIIEYSAIWFEPKKLTTS